MLLSAFRAGDSAVFAGVGVPGSSDCEEHLDCYNYQDGSHGDETGHGRIPFIPKCRETRVGQGYEGGGEEMDKCSRNEHASAEVARDEEEVMWDGKSREAAGYDGERAC
ncbi:MAG: hypothetical protein LQ341_005847 [Variospora aurantia]|nr:MAG: hypothetical protein LQ341_005847 [Variospora aurantia]